RDRRRGMHRLRRLRARLPRRLHRRPEGVGRRRYNRGVPFAGQPARDPGPVGESQALSVTELNRRVARLLETEFPEVSVEGAVSQVKRAPSGHLCFAPQDAASRVDAIMWGSSARMLPFTPSEGLQVRVTGRLTIYAQTGRYQIIVTRMEPA